MYEIDFNHPIHIHFIGIGGISMSGLAEILMNRKFIVSGSDMKASALTEHLGAVGAVINYPQMRENIAKAVGSDVSSISVKATTEEGLGFTGDGSGIAAHAVCLIEEI